MGNEQDQVRPLASSPPNRMTNIEGEEEEAILISKKLIRRKNCIKCFGCFTAILLILVVIVIVLTFTVFHIKNPDIRLNGAKITKIKLINGMIIPDPSVNITVEVNVSVKNPNAVSFRYDNSTVTLFYDGNKVGEGKTPSGIAKARRTENLILAVEIMTARLLSYRSLASDVIGSGVLSMSSYTRIEGRVKVMGVFKKHVTVIMNCTMMVDVRSGQLRDQKCNRQVDM